MNEKSHSCRTENIPKIKTGIGIPNSELYVLKKKKISPFKQRQTECEKSKSEREDNDESWPDRFSGYTRSSDDG